MRNAKAYGNPLIYLTPSHLLTTRTPMSSTGGGGGEGGQNKSGGDDRSRLYAPYPPINLDFPVYVMVNSECKKVLLSRNFVRKYLMPG